MDASEVSTCGSVMKPSRTGLPSSKAGAFLPKFCPPSTDRKSPAVVATSTVLAEGTTTFKTPRGACTFGGRNVVGIGVVKICFGSSVIQLSAPSVDLYSPTALKNPLL